MKPSPAPTIRLDHDQIARVINEALVAMNILMYDVPPKHWADLDAAQRRPLLLAVAYVQAHPGAGPGAYHDHLVGKLREDGWQRGEYRDVLRRIHPLATAYAELPPKYRAKQGLIFAMAAQLLRPAG